MSKNQPEVFDFVPVIDVLDLDVDKSTAAAISLAKHFDYITQIIFVQTVSDAAMEFTEFAEAVTLTNGFYMRIDGEQFGPLIKDASDLATLGKMVITASDADAGKVAYIRQFIVDIAAMTPGSLGLQLATTTKDRVFDIYGQDDMTACVKFKAVVLGWKGV